MLLNYTFLKELPTYMCQILDYVCPCKFEKKTFSPKMEDVLGTMLTIFDSWRKSLESFEDIDAVKYRKMYHPLSVELGLLIKRSWKGWAWKNYPT